MSFGRVFFKQFDEGNPKRVGYDF